MAQPAALREATKHNLDRTFGALGISDGTLLSISDPVLPTAVVAVVHIK